MNSKKTTIAIICTLCVFVFCFVMATSVHPDKNILPVSEESSEENVANQPLEQDEAQSNVNDKNISANVYKTSKNPVVINSDDDNASEDDYFVVGGLSESNDVNNSLQSFALTDDDKKVCWKIENGVLTLAAYELDQDPVVDGFIRNVPDSLNRPGWFSKFLPVWKVVINENMSNVKTTLMKSWFSTAYKEGRSQGRPHVKEFDGIQYLNFSEAIDTSYMFAGCGSYGLTKSINTKSIFEFSKATNIDAMFASTSTNVLCGNNEPTIKTSTALTSCNYLFQNNIDVKRPVIDDLDFTNAKNAAFMFCGCKNLESTKEQPMTFKNFKLANMESLIAFFCNCSSLKYLDLGSWGNPTADTNLSNMFNSCANLETIHVEEGTDWTVATNKSYMFYYKGEYGNAYKLLGPTRSYPGPESSSGDYARVGLGIDVGGTDTPGYFTAKTAKIFSASSTNDNLTFIFHYDDIKAPEGTTVYVVKKDFDQTSTAGLPWDAVKGNVGTVKFDKDYSDFKAINCSHWFEGFGKLTSFDASNFDTSDAISLAALFQNCYSLQTINLASLKTSKVTDMSNMFYMYRGDPLDSQDNALESVTLFGDGSNFTTQNCRYLSGMFYNCRHVTEYEAFPTNSFNSAVNISQMFDLNHNLKRFNSNVDAEYNFSSYDFSNVQQADWFLASNLNLQSFTSPTKFNSPINSEGFFGYDSGITDLSKIDISMFGNKYLKGMFRNCTGLTVVHMSSGITEISETCFTACTNLKKFVATPGLTSVGNNAFYGCSRLENFVIPRTDSTVTKYGSDVFYGTPEDGTVNSAPLVLVSSSGDTGTSGQATSGRKSYIYTPISKFEDLPTSGTDYRNMRGDKNYFYLTDNVKSTYRIIVGTHNGEDDIVLDLNGYNIDRGLTTEKKYTNQDVRAGKITTDNNYVMSSMNSCKLTFRIDNTSCINDPEHLDGKITGGFACNAEPNGGGFSFTQSPVSGCSQSVSLVNGCIYNNATFKGFGGGVALVTPPDDNTTMKFYMYGGVIGHNIAYRKSQPGATTGNDYAPSSGGVDVAPHNRWDGPQNCVFYMYGGYIVDNGASDDGDRQAREIVSPGGGVGIRGSVMNMYGGIIGGTSNSTVTANWSNRGNWGGAGVYIFYDSNAHGASGTLNFYGGYILNNYNAAGTDATNYNVGRCMDPVPAERGSCSFNDLRSDKSQLQFNVKDITVTRN